MANPKTQNGIAQCPYCAEEIKKEAIKCKHCGSDLSEKPRANTKKVRAKDHESYGTFTLLSFLFPVIGGILGIAYLIKSDPLDKKLGEHAFVASIFAVIIWGLGWMVLMSIL